MKSFLVLLVLFGLTYGGETDIVNWEDIYKGDVKIPENEKAVKKENWEELDKDGELNIQWYGQSSDPVQLAFDQKGVLAGARLAIPTGKDDDFYKNSKVFETKTISDKPHYVATVILTDLDVLKEHGGRRTTEDDEIAQNVLVKHNDGNYEQIQRDACLNSEPGVFVEQGCKGGYGLVFSPLKEEEKSCKYPFFLVYNEEQNVGELLGFGWLVPSSAGIKGSKALTKTDKKTLFPAAPSCVEGLIPVNIWLAKKESKKAKCKEPIGKFTEKRCQHKRRGGGDEDF